MFGTMTVLHIVTMTLHTIVKISTLTIDINTLILIFILIILELLVFEVQKIMTRITFTVIMMAAFPQHVDDTVLIKKYSSLL